MRHEQFMKDAQSVHGIDGGSPLAGVGVDMVNSPPHYNQSGIECIQAIQAALGPNFKYYLQGSIMKYLWRFEYKSKPIEDLDKADWYLGRLREEVVADDKS